jgi:hypothetical protein
MVNKFLTYGFLFLIFNSKIYSQITYSNDIKDYNNLRFAQLVKTDSNIATNSSFMIKSTQNIDNLSNPTYYNPSRLRLENIKASIELQNNSNLPYGYNDGSMFPAIGLQKRVSFGFLVKNDFLEINFQPEFVQANNNKPTLFKGNPKDGNYWARYYLINTNYIDNYRQFGNNKINYNSLGQSRIGYRKNNHSIGFSNENIWWGPGVLNSLIFTNQAPGFKHLYYQTNKPILTKLGSVEYNVIAGRLNNILPNNQDDSLMRTIWPGGILNKKSANRLILSGILTLQPKPMPNLYIGLAFSSQNYMDTSLFKSKYQHIQTFMFRYIIPNDHAEFYGELGYTNSILGFVLGGKKLFKYNNNRYFELGVEVTQLGIMDPRKIFVINNVYGPPQRNSWYTNTSVLQGYTNNAQLLGAGIGPGSNAQTVYFNYKYRNSKIGLQLERINHNNDFYYYAYLSKLGYSIYSSYYVDLNAGLKYELSLSKSIGILAYANYSKAMNYRWVRIDNGTPYYQGSSLSDKVNMLSYFSLIYKFDNIHQ